MNLVEAHLRALASGIELVAECAGATMEQLRALGPASAAADLLALYEVYFGATAFTRKQAAARAAAQGNGHSLPTLLVIERYARRLKKQHLAWGLRVELARVRGDEKAVARRARVLLKEIQARPEPQPGVKILQGPVLSKLILTAPADVIEDIRHNIDPADPVGSLRRAFTDGTLARPVTQTLAVLPLPQWAHLIRSGEPRDADVSVRLSNGATITGAELVQRELADEGLVLLVDREGGAVDLYRTRRTATRKQRIMVAGSTTVCVAEGCNRGLDRCHIHHIREWAKGGQTNIANLTALCPFHNGVNGQPGWGRVEHRRGRAVWVRPG